LRIEVAVVGTRSQLEQAAENLFGDRSAIEAASVRVGERALEHLFRIAAGLESPVLGEREILTQFRQSAQQARERGTGEDGLLLKLLDTAVSVGRQARQLLPESPHDSMAAVAAQIVGGADRVAILGSGVMARAIVRSAIPQYPIGHAGWMRQVDGQLAANPGLHLAGWGYRGIGISSLGAEAVRIASAVAGKGPS
jgi:glutamyl-tRNA reductase